MAKQKKITSIFDVDEFAPLRAGYEARKERFTNNWHRYKATSYRPGGGFKTDMGKYIAQRIADGVRPVFTPLARAVNLDVSLIPAGWPLIEDAHQAAWKEIARASRWDVEGDLFTRFVTSMGEAGLLIVDDRVNGRLLMQVVRPDTYITAPTSRYDKTPTLVVFINDTIGTDDKPRQEATVIDAATVRTFVNGQPMALYGGAAVYANQMGFVPFVECKNDPGDGWGEPTFDDAVSSLDQVNLQATYLGNIIQKHAEPQWAAFGAEKGDLEKSGDKVWFFPEGSDVKAILAAVDFPGVLAFIQEMKVEVKESLPELALSKLVGLNRVATDTIEIQMIEAVSKITRLRKPIDLAIADGLRMVGRAAETMRGMDDMTVLNDPAVQVDPARPVIVMDTLTKLQVEQASQANQLTAMALEQERLRMDVGEGVDE